MGGVLGSAVLGSGYTSAVKWKWKGRWQWLLVGAAVLLLPLGGAWLRVLVDGDAPSLSSGRVGAGRLVHGHVLPPWGEGFRTYSLLGAALGRQYVHGAVREVLLAAFAARARAERGRVHVIGETGQRGGGRLLGHKTHQSGLSVDLFLPVRDAAGERAVLPTWPWQGLGYWHEFDAHGRCGELLIDFAELARLLKEIQLQAAARGVGIERIILTPEYVPLLLATEAGRGLGSLGEKLTRRPVWVRHDEHVHIDFIPPR